jgi:hypothetical protein
MAGIVQGRVYHSGRIMASGIISNQFGHNQLTAFICEPGCLIRPVPG